jgi:hypothetical protein
MFVLSFFCIAIALLVVSLNAQAKFEIHKCILENGTISFQEKSCETKYPNTSPTQPKHKNTTSKKPKRKSTSQTRSATQALSKKSTRKQNPWVYTKLPNIGVNDNTSHVTSNQVKGYQMSLETLKRWGVINKVFNNKILHMKFLDERSASKMSLLVDYIYPDGKIFSQSELVDYVNLVGSRYSQGSAESEVRTEILSVNTGLGALATFTHSNSVKNYNFATKGIIFKNKWMIQFTLLSNSLHNPSYQFALQSLTSTLQVKKL